MDSNALSLNALQASLANPKHHDIDYLHGPRRGHRHAQANGGLNTQHVTAMAIFRQELSMAMQSRFGGVPTAQATDAEGSRELASDILKSVRQLSYVSRERGSETLAQIRTDVSTSADTAAALAGESPELDEAVGLVDEGIGEIEEEANRNLPSSASVLSVDVRSSQRSNIGIVTQEGDRVRFQLVNTDQLSATDVAIESETGTTTLTEIQLSSSSSVRLFVQGDLNEAEFAAIQSIFDQAGTIAAQFFNGDVATAFDAMSGLEVDADQLAKVRLDFRTTVVSEVTYAQLADSPRISEPDSPAPIDTTPQPLPVVDQPAVVDEPAVVEAPVVVATPVAEPDAQNTGQPVPGDAAEATITPIPQPVDQQSALAGFFDLINSFLASLSEGFEGEADDTGQGFTLHYSQFFKLEILKSVIHAAAPADSGDAPQVVGDVIDAVNADEAGEELDD